MGSPDVGPQSPGFSPRFRYSIQHKFYGSFQEGFRLPRSCLLFHGEPIRGRLDTEHVGCINIVCHPRDTSPEQVVEILVTVICCCCSKAVHVFILVHLTYSVSDGCRYKDVVSRASVASSAPTLFCVCPIVPRMSPYARKSSVRRKMSVRAHHMQRMCVQLSTKIRVFAWHLSVGMSPPLCMASQKRLSWLTPATSWRLLYESCKLQVTCKLKKQDC